jgi:hypothetical protein
MNEADGPLMVHGQHFGMLQYDNHLWKEKETLVMQF